MQKPIRRLERSVGGILNDIEHAATSPIPDSQEQSASDDNKLAKLKRDTLLRALRRP